MSTKDEALEQLKAGFDFLSQICMAILERDEQLVQLVREYMAVCSGDFDGLARDYHLPHTANHLAIRQDQRDDLYKRAKKLLEDAP